MLISRVSDVVKRFLTGQGDQRAHALDLLQQCGLRIALLRDGFDLPVVPLKLRGLHPRWEGCSAKPKLRNRLNQATNSLQIAGLPEVAIRSKLITTLDVGLRLRGGENNHWSLSQ